MLTSVLPWLTAHLIISLCAAPMMFRVCTRLHDRGYGLSKVMGLLLVTFGAWWLANLPLGRSWTAFNFSAITISLGFIVAMSCLSILSAHREIAAFIRARWRVLLTYEAVGLAAFALMLSFRAAVPHISYHNANAGFIDHAAEKFTDFAILNSLLTSETFPPHDAWVSGATLNYYYFGHLLWATMIKYVSVRPEVGFNLALASLFALVCVQSFSLGYNLTRRLRWGFMALFLIVLASNLDGFLQLAGIISQKLFGPSGGRLWTMQSPWYLNYSFWRSSRAIENTINEFPAFSFVLGDLHGHVSSLAIYLAGLGLSIQMWRSARGFDSLFSYELHCLDELFFAAITAGALYAANSWDAITFTGVIMMSLWASQPGWRGDGRCLKRTLASFAASLIAAIILLVGVVAFFRPFSTNFSAPLPMPTLHDWKSAAEHMSMGALRFPVKFAGASLRSDPFEWITHWTLHLAAPLALLLAFSKRKNCCVRPLAEGGAGSDSGLQRPGAAAPLLIGAAAACVLMPLWNGWIAVLAFLASLAGLIAFARCWQPPAIRLMLGWLILFCALCWFCELFYFDDIFSGEIERINTIFKIYYGMWPLLGLASIIALRRLIRLGNGRGIHLRALAWITPLLILGGAYTVIAPVQRIATSPHLGHYRVNPGDKKPDDTDLPLWAQSSARALNLEEALDGLRYMQYLHLDDYKSVLWIRTNLPNNTVMLEAAGTQYTYAGRFGALTGRPVFAGWLMHELGWRNKNWKTPQGKSSDFATEMQRRTEIARDVYETTDALHAHQLLREEGVEYVIIGAAERELYEVAEEKFFRMGEMAYSSGNTLICRISPQPPEPLLFEPPLFAPPISAPTDYSWAPRDAAPLSESFTSGTMLTTGTPTTESLRNEETTMSVLNRILEYGARKSDELTSPEAVGTPWD